jgi:hypothetical protein
LHFLSIHISDATALEFSKDSLVSREDWSTLRLVRHDELVESLSSYLIIKAPDFDIVAQLSPLEVYSADNLGVLLHSRMSGNSRFYPTDKIGSRAMSIGPNIPCVIDPSGLYHVAREGSSHFAEHSNLLVDEKECSNLCQAVIKYGKSDGSRSDGQFRVNFGCGGQHMPGGVPAKLVGFDFEKRLQEDDSFDSVATLKSVGSLTEFLWNVMVGLQREAKDPPIAPDKRRHEEYGRLLSEKLNMDDSVSFEDITLVVSILSPRFDGVREHCDKMNDSLVGYIIHFQVCCITISSELNTTTFYFIVNSYHLSCVLFLGHSQLPKGNSPVHDPVLPWCGRHQEACPRLSCEVAACDE